MRTKENCPGRVFRRPEVKYSIGVMMEQPLVSSSTCHLFDTILLYDLLGKI